MKVLLEATLREFFGTIEISIIYHPDDEEKPPKRYSYRVGNEKVVAEVKALIKRRQFGKVFNVLKKANILDAVGR